MMTIELTEDHLDLLKNGAQQFGRCSIIVPDENGDYVAISYNGLNHRRGRPPKARAPKPQGESEKP